MTLSESKMNGMFFNQNFSLLAIATNLGYKIYETSNFLQVSDENYDQSNIGPLSIVKLYFESRLLFFVGTIENLKFKSNQLIVWDEMRKEKLGQITFKNDIRDFYISRNFIIVIQPNRISYFDMQNLSFLFTFEKTVDNHKLITFSCNNEYSVLCYLNELDSKSISIIQNKDSSKKSQKVIQTKFDSIEHILVNKKGDLLSVNSINVAFIHIYSLQTYSLLYCLWRGNEIYNHIEIKSFSKKNKFIALTDSLKNLFIYELQNDLANCRCERIKNQELKKLNKQKILSSVLTKIKGIFKSVKPAKIFAKYILNSETDSNQLKLHHLDEGISFQKIIFEKINELVHIY